MRDPEKRTSYYIDGSVCYEEYCLDSVCHRVDGPSLIGYNLDGSVGYERCFIDDKCYSKEEYEQEIKEVKELDKANQLLDPRSWVRELGRTS